MDDLPDNEDEEQLRRAQLARTEARTTISEQIDTLDDLDEKAIQIFRLNILLASVVATALSVVSTTNFSVSLLINKYTKMSYGFLLVSTISAAASYTTTATEIGVNADSVRNKILDTGSDFLSTNKNLAKAYAKAIETNYETNASNVFKFTITLNASVISLYCLALGLLQIGSENSFPLWVDFTIPLFIVLFGEISGIYGTTRRWYKLTEPHKRLEARIANITSQIASVACYVIEKWSNICDCINLVLKQVGSTIKTVFR